MGQVPRSNSDMGMEAFEVAQTAYRFVYQPHVSNNETKTISKCRISTEIVLNKLHEKELTMKTTKLISSIIPLDLTISVDFHPILK